MNGLIWTEEGPRGFRPRLPDSDWTPPITLERPPSGLVAIDLETRDPGLTQVGPGWPFGDGQIVGVALGWQDYACYLPIAHAGGGNLDPGVVRRYLTAQWERDDITWCFAKATYDLGWLSAEWGLAPPPRILDVQVLAALLNEYRMSYSLGALAKDYLGEYKGDAELSQAAEAFGYKNAKDNLWRLPSPFVGPYAEQDARLTFRLAITFLDLIKEQDLGAAADLEHSLIPILLDMRARGIRIDVAKAEKLRLRYQKRERHALDYVKQQTGINVDPWDAVSIAAALDGLGIKAPRTKSGGPSIQKEWLAGLQNDIADAVLAARRYQKAYGTFIDGHILGHLRKGRVHAEFNQLRSEKEDGGVFGTVSYRFSSSNPNLQQLPGRDEELTVDLRGCFIPEEGDDWGSLDYSQQEPRQAIHFASVADIPGAEEAVQAILADPSWDFHNYASQMTGIPRKQVKTISLGRMYSMGDAELCRRLGLPVIPAVDDDGRPIMRRNGTQVFLPGEEGRAVIENYATKFPWVQGLQEFCQGRAKARGYLILIDGYRARFSTRKGEFGDFPHKAMNRLVQGSSAIQTKRAMVGIWNERNRARLLLQLHDEFGLSWQGADERLVRDIKEIMIGAVKLRVPMKVDATSATDWGKASIE